VKNQLPRLDMKTPATEVAGVIERRALLGNQRQK
jgi:hypothetical protein